MPRWRTFFMTVAVLVVVLIFAVISTKSESRKYVINGDGYSLLVGEASQGTDLGDFRELRGQLVAISGGCLAIQTKSGREEVLLSPFTTRIDANGDIHIPGASHTYRVRDALAIWGGDLGVSPRDFKPAFPTSCGTGRVFSYSTIAQ